jgi:hypothetical protein
MSHPGPSAAEIVLSDEERAELVRRAGLPERRRADRARIILACADGMSNAGAAQELGVAVKSVSRSCHAPPAIAAERPGPCTAVPGTRGRFCPPIREQRGRPGTCALRGPRSGRLGAS